MVQHIDQIVSVAATMRDSSDRLSKPTVSSISQLCLSVKRDSCVWRLHVPSTDQRVETGGVSLARESRRVSNHPHTETNSSESHQAHGDSDDGRSAEREEENRR